MPRGRYLAKNAKCNVLPVLGAGRLRRNLRITASNQAVFALAVADPPRPREGNRRDVRDNYREA